MSNHHPLRTCIACRKKNLKNDLLRLVRTPAKIVEIDRAQKKTGRGAYLCLVKTCLADAVKKSLASKILRCPPAPGFHEQLLEISTDE